jgi:hypothetical protein
VLAFSILVTSSRKRVWGIIRMSQGSCTSISKRRWYLKNIIAAHQTECVKPSRSFHRIWDPTKRSNTTDSDSVSFSLIICQLKLGFPCPSNIGDWGKGTCMIESFHLADRFENSRLPCVVGWTAISPMKRVDCRWAAQHGVKHLLTLLKYRPHRMESISCMDLENKNEYWRLLGLDKPESWIPMSVEWLLYLSTRDHGLTRWYFLGNDYTSNRFSFEKTTTIELASRIYYDIRSEQCPDTKCQIKGASDVQEGVMAKTKKNK